MDFAYKTNERMGRPVKRGRDCRVLINRRLGGKEFLWIFRNVKDCGTQKNASNVRTEKGMAEKYPLLAKWK